MSRLFCTEGIGSIKDRYIFLDNNFISLIFKDDDLLVGFLEFFSENYFLIDPFTRFEFLRDVFMPSEYDRKREFIDNRAVFMEPPSQSQIMKEVMSNALLISKMVAHNAGPGKVRSPDLVDLLLSARLMMYSDSLIITSNKKDFPPCLFDVKEVINYEHDGSGEMQMFAVLSFSRDKLAYCQNKLEKVNNDQ